MNIASVSNIEDYSTYGLTSSPSKEDKTTAFDNLFQAAVDMVKQTSNYTDAAKKQETDYALGISDNTNDLLVAQQKANLSLQYTVAIRNHVLDAYKEIMNLQF